MSDKSQHVTAVITHQVHSGHAASYEEWIKGIATDARQFEGHLGVNILRPQPGAAALDYVIVLRFDSSPNLDAWLNSDIRKGWIDRVQPLIQEQESVQVLTGLEGWFQLPKKSKSVPKRYKQAILIWLGVMIVSLAVHPLLTPVLQYLPWLLQVAIRAAITVILLSYVIMPRLTRWFKHWLFKA